MTEIIIEKTIEFGVKKAEKEEKKQKARDNWREEFYCL